MLAMLAATLSVMLSTTPAAAQSACPAGYGTPSTTCQVHQIDAAGTMVNVCDVSGGGNNYWQCDVWNSGAAATVITVTDYDTSGTAVSYESWGTLFNLYTAAWVSFCCQYTDTNNAIEYVQTQGSAYGDHLHFLADVSGTTYRLQGTNSNPAQTLVAQIYGEDGNDTIYGSDETAYYTEYLYGDTNNDTIRASAGTIDYIYGGEDDDVLYGGDGVDYIYGDAGNDILVGGNGNDNMFGGEGNDEMAGNAGDDTMTGDEGGDALCGDAGDDVLDDGDSTFHLLEILWGAESGDTVTCQDSSTEVDTNSSADPLCNAALSPTTRPGACP